MTALRDDPVVQALRQWVRTTTGLADGQVILAQQPGSQPAWPYVVIEPYLAARPVGQSDEQRLGDGQVEHVHQEVIVVQVDVYGDSRAGDARELAAKACRGLSLLAVREALQAAGLANFDRSFPRQLSFKGETQFIERWMFEPQFNLVTKTVEAVEVVESIGFSGTLSGVPISG